MRLRTITASLFALCVPLLAGCGGGGGGGSSNPPGTGSGTLTVLATDAPFVHDIVTAARITVDRVTIHASGEAGDGDSGFLTLYDGPPREVDLLSLQNAVTTELAHSDLASGSYRQIRVRVTEAELFLVNGNSYSTAAGNLHLTSQDTSGFKVFVDPPIDIVDGVARTLLLDFDLTHTFHPIPANDPLDANTYSFHPVIHAANLSTTGSIRGHVTRPVGVGGLEPVVGATVYILPAGVTNLDSAVATTATVEGGAYAQLGLQPGFYDVHAAKDGLEGTVADQPVTAGSFNEVDVVID